MPMSHVCSVSECPTCDRSEKTDAAWQRLAVLTGPQPPPVVPPSPTPWHTLDGTLIVCPGAAQGCWLCLTKNHLAHDAAQTPQPPSWGWYAGVLLQYATKEAMACQQKLEEYGLSLDDVFAQIERLSQKLRLTWQRTLWEQAVRHDLAYHALLERWDWDACNANPLGKTGIYRRVADRYGYTCLELAWLLWRSIR